MHNISSVSQQPTTIRSAIDSQADVKYLPQMSKYTYCLHIGDDVRRCMQADIKPMPAFTSVTYNLRHTNRQLSDKRLTYPSTLNTYHRCPNTSASTSAETSTVRCRLAQIRSMRIHRLPLISVRTPATIGLGQTRLTADLYTHPRTLKTYPASFGGDIHRWMQGDIKPQRTFTSFALVLWPNNRQLSNQRQTHSQTFNTYHGCLDTPVCTSTETSADACWLANNI